jgi:hypothetical protein
MRYNFRFPVRIVIENTYRGKLVGLEFINPCIKHRKPFWLVDDLSGMLQPMDEDEE